MSFVEVCCLVVDDDDCLFVLVGVMFCVVARFGGAGGCVFDVVVVVFREWDVFVVEVWVQVVMVWFSAFVLVFFLVVFVAWLVVGDDAAWVFLFGSLFGWVVICLI